MKIQRSSLAWTAVEYPGLYEPAQPDPHTGFDCHPY